MSWPSSSATLLLGQVKLTRQVFENADGSPTLVPRQLNCYDRQTLIKDTLQLIQHCRQVPHAEKRPFDGRPNLSGQRAEHSPNLITGAVGSRIEAH